LQCLSGHSPDHPIVAEILHQISNLRATGQSVVFAGYLDAVAFLATRPPMRQLCTDRSFQIELSALTFALAFVTLFYPCGKTNGTVLLATN
jgi:hypothetical protein